MNRERLEHLRALLLSQSENDSENFDLRHWRRRIVKDGKECGYAACAVGTAMCDPWHNEQGLRYSARDNAPACGALVGWDAVETYFDIDSFEAFTLFSPDSYSNPKSRYAVAHRISDFIWHKEHNT